MPDSPITGEYLNELATHIDDTWAPQYALDKRLLLHIHGEALVEAPNTKEEGRRRKLEPEALHLGVAQTVIATILPSYGQPAVPGVQYTGEGSRSESNRDMAEKGIKEAYERLNPPVDSPRDARVEQQVGLGRGATLLVAGGVDDVAAYWWDMPQPQPGEPEEAYAKRFNEWQGKAPLPIAFMNLPAQGTFPPDLGSLEYELLCRMRMSNAELARIFAPDEVARVWDGSAETRYQVTEFAIYSDKNHLVYGAVKSSPRASLGWGDHRVSMGQKQEWEVLRSIEHKMGRTAIRIHPGKTSSRKEPGFFWRSALFDVRDLLDDIGRLGAWAATGRKFNSLPEFVAYLNRENFEGPGDAARKLAWKPGDIPVLDAGDPQTGRPAERIEALHVPSFGERDLALLQLAMGRVDLTTGVTEALQGVFGPGDQAAWARNFSAEMGRLRLRPYTLGVSAADLDDYEGIVRAVSAFGEPVTLARFESGQRNNIVLRPDEIAQYEPVLQVDYSPQIPVNELAMKQFGFGMLRDVAGSPSLMVNPAWVMETFMGIDQPLDHIKEAMQFRWAMGEEAQRFYEQYITKKTEMLIAEQAGVSIAEVMASDLPEQVKAMLVQGIQGPEQAAQAVGGGAPMGAAQGARRAGMPFSSLPNMNVPAQQGQPVSGV